MAVAIRDVARESGVNISTVSRALNYGCGVNGQTRQHVVAVGARLNYRVNRVARGLVTGRSRSLALLVSDIRSPFFAEVARGAEDAARGLRIPGDLSLIDFDNIELSSVIHPPLATIHQPKYEIGRTAVEILLRLARDKDRQAPERRLLGGQLIERQSCRQLL